MISVKGYEAQKIPFYSQGSPKRTGDSYRIDRIAFRGFHALYFFQVDPTGTPELIIIHHGQGPKALDQRIKFLLFQLEQIFLKTGKVQVKFQCCSPWL